MASSRFAALGICLFALGSGLVMGRSRAAAGDRLPDFEAVALDGTPVLADDLRGKVVLLNVWASWCGPCREELPALDSLARTVDTTRIAFVALSDDADPAAARQFLDAFALPSLQIGLGLGRLAQSFGYSGLPYSLVLDAEGRVVRTWTGFGGPPHVAAIGALLDSLAR